MSYPGEGYNMSNYGFKPYSPEQTKESWRENVLREQKIAKRHNTAKISGRLGQLDLSKKITYYNNSKKHQLVSSYDQTFHFTEGYCQKLWRDDLQHTQGLKIHEEEAGKNIPILSNSIYGHRPSLEVPSRDHVRIAIVRREFYRSSGTNISPSV